MPQGAAGPSLGLLITGARCEKDRRRAGSAQPVQGQSSRYSGKEAYSPVAGITLRHPRAPIRRPGRSAPASHASVAVRPSGVDRVAVTRGSGAAERPARLCGCRGFLGHASSLGPGCRHGDCGCRSQRWRAQCLPDALQPLALWAAQIGLLAEGRAGAATARGLLSGGFLSCQVGLGQAERSQH